jgi:multicomponent Na+:H+ antiporter subunit C
MTLFIAISIGVLFSISIFLILRRNVIRSAMGLVLLANAINLFLLTAGRSSGDAPPYDGVTGAISDPLPQALVLTAIVISMGGLAFVLAMLYVISARYRTSDMDEVQGLRR